MNRPLAIFAPVIGVPTETFIKRHMEDLLPGGTVVVAKRFHSSQINDNQPNCPYLLLDQIGHFQSNNIIKYLYRIIETRSGWNLESQQEVVRKFLMEHGVRVIMVEYLDWFLDWLPLAQDLGIHLWGHAHGYDVSARLKDPKWQVEYLRYNQTDGVITMSQYSRKRLIDIGLEPAKIRVVPYGVRVPSKPIRKQKSGIIRCIAVGRMVRKKAPILTLDAFRRAMEKYPQLRLDYVGSGVLFPEINQYIHAYKLGEKVRLYGSQTNDMVIKLMADADIYIQHSITDSDTGDEEGLPVAILEAMANSLPVVATHHAGIPEAVMDGVTGYLVNEGDNVGMAERIVSLSQDSDLRIRMGEAGWRRAKAYYSWERESEDLLRVLGLII